MKAVHMTGASTTDIETRQENPVLVAPFQQTGVETVHHVFTVLYVSLCTRASGLALA